MSRLIALAAILLAGFAALRAAQASRTRRLALSRLGALAQDSAAAPMIAEPEETEIRTYPPRYRFAAPLAGLLAAAAIHWLTALLAPIAIAAGILVGMMVYILEMQWAASRTTKIEAQLADAIDQMVASLRSGSALLAALEATSREARRPLRDELESLIGRIRLGEDPREAVRDLAATIPLESFRLFAHCLLVHWETGGSLAPSLRIVGRTVRDRLEISRRISSQAVESQISVFAVMGVAYGLTLLSLNTNPGPIKKLLYSSIGSYGAGAVMILQAAGMFWIWRMSRIRF